MTIPDASTVITCEYTVDPLRQDATVCSLGTKGCSAFCSYCFKLCTNKVFLWTLYVFILTAYVRTSLLKGCAYACRRVTT